jgi:hypothetical protein
MRASHDGAITRARVRRRVLGRANTTTRGETRGFDRVASRMDVRATRSRDARGGNA